MSNTNYLLAYGSLRKDEYNFERINRVFKDSLKYINTQVIEGFALYSLGVYPGVKATPSILNNKLTVELLEVSDEALNYIHRMEIGANYEAAKTTVINNEQEKVEATIYLYKGNISKQTHIISGDWSLFLRNLRG